MRSYVLAASLLLLGLSPTILRASSRAPTTPPPMHPRLFDQVESFRLDNGMLFLLLPRHDVPMVCGSIHVKAGNVDNPEGATGLAHMFEHMAFKGTDRIGTRDAAAERAVGDSIVLAGRELTRLLRNDPDAHATRIADLRERLAVLEEHAAEFIVPMEFPREYDGYTYDFNAYTSQDFTVYTATLPANNLEVWMLMESERLQNPVFREFYAELEVVKEERRKRTDDNPEAMASEKLKALAFDDHPYRNPTIGYMEDLETLNPGMIEDFWRVHYVPADMVAALAGDFDIDGAKDMIIRYFGDIPARPPAPPPSADTRDRADARRAVLRQGEERVMMMAFPGLAPDDPRRPAADLLSSALSRDKTSRLVRRLDLDEGVARHVETSSTGGYNRYAGLFTITVDLMEGAENEQVETLVWEELDRLVTEPVSQSKLDEIAASYSKGFVFQLQRNADLAEMLAGSQAALGDWRRAYLRFSDYDQVTAGDVAALAQDLFKRDKASVVYLEPEDPTATTEGGRP